MVQNIPRHVAERAGVQDAVYIKGRGVRKLVSQVWARSVKPRGTMAGWWARGDPISIRKLHGELFTSLLSPRKHRGLHLHHGVPKGLVSCNRAGQRRDRGELRRRWWYGHPRADTRVGGRRQLAVPVAGQRAVGGEEEELRPPFLPPLASSLLWPAGRSGEAERRVCRRCLCEFLSAEIFHLCLLSPDGRGARLRYNLPEASRPRRSDQGGTETRRESRSPAWPPGPLHPSLPYNTLHSPRPGPKAAQASCLCPPGGF